jgi:lysophospholipase L1-like esterase
MRYKNKEYRVVMLGDSITAGVAWNELLGISGIANRGIGSDTTGGILGRLSNIYELNPKICFIMAGINDIGKNIAMEIIINNMTQIIDELENHGIEVIIQSTLYVSDEYGNWKKQIGR